MALGRGRTGKQHLLGTQSMSSTVLGIVPHLRLTATLQGKDHSKRKHASVCLSFTLLLLCNTISLLTPGVWVFYTPSDFAILAECPTINFTLVLYSWS